MTRSIDRGRAAGAPAAANVLIVNQHGDNRGDEAACRAMLHGIEEHASVPVRFTVLHQFAARDARIDVPQQVRWISLVPSLPEAIRLVLFSLALLVGLRWRSVLGAWGREVADAYLEADIVVSAPGGPYFGDPYAGHELVHWFYVWLAGRHRLPTMLYAPSVGPFRKRILNPVRRRLFRRFRAITVREEVSRSHLDGLLADRAPAVVLATDSALQRPLSAFDRREYFGSGRAGSIDRFLVAVSAMEWSFPGHPDPSAAQGRYERVVLDSLTHLHRRLDAHMLFAPQLYGSVHSDVAYLEALGRRMPPDVSWELVDPACDSDHQQRALGMADIYFATRYHPQVFAIGAAVPGVCIYYQHKAVGFLRHLGLESFAFPIDDLDGDAVRRALDEVVARREELSSRIAAALPTLRESSARSSEIAADLLHEAIRP